MAAKTGTLGELDGFLHFSLRLLQPLVTLLCQTIHLFLFQPAPVVVPLVGSVGGEETVNLAAVTPPGVIVAFRLGLRFSHLGVKLDRLVHHALGFGLEEKHPDIGVALADQDVIPLGQCVIIAESLAVLAVKFLDLRLLLLPRAGELLQARQCALDLETGLDHLCTAVGLDFCHFTGFLRRFLLRVRVSVPGNDKSRDNGRKSQRKRGHQGLRRTGGDTQGDGQPGIGGRQQVLHLHDRHQTESGILVQGIEHLLEPHRDGHHALHAGLYFRQVLVLRGEERQRARGGGEQTGKAAHTGHEPLEVRVIVREDFRLGVQVGKRVGKERGLLRHLPVLLSVLFTFQAQAGHAVLELAQLHGKAFAALPCLLLFSLEPGKGALFLLERLLRGVQLIQGGHLGLSRSGTPVGFLQRLDVALDLPDDFLLLPDPVGQALATGRGAFFL